MWNIIKDIFTIITIFGTILGLFAAYNSIFIPVISLNQTISLDSSDPFATQFILSNEGPVDIDKLTIEFHQNSIKTTNNNTFQNNTSLFSFLSLKSGQKMTIPFVFRQIIGLSSQDKVTTADIFFKITFTSVIWPHFTYSRNFRFVTQQAKDGNLYWFPQPL